MKFRRPVAPLAALAAALAVAVPAHATQYWTNSALLTDFFKSAAKVRHTEWTIPPADAAAIANALGAPLKKTTWTIRIAEDANQQRVGYAILDDEIGLHDPIDFGVKFGLSGAVERVEVREYREPFGDQVRYPSFCGQFIGKTAKDPIVAGKDIAIITGATYSSKSMALGVKRGTLVMQAALKNGIP